MPTSFLVVLERFLAGYPNSLVLVFGFPLLLLSTACSPFFTGRGVPTKHVVMFDERGFAMDPTGNSCPQPPNSSEGFKELPLQEIPNLTEWSPCNGKFNRLKAYKRLQTEQSEAAYEGYLNDMMKHLLDEGDNAFEEKNKKNLRNVAIFIHGGLNDPKSTLDRARDLTKEITDDGVYPIFVNWQSSLPSSLLDHLWRVWRGKWYGSDRWYLAFLNFPVDAARVVARAPITLVQDYDISFVARQARLKEKDLSANASYCRFRKAYEAALRSGDSAVIANTLAISKGPNRLTKWDHLKSALVGNMTSPVKVGASFILDPFGSAAWDMMKRRTHLLFDVERENVGSCCPDNFHGDGGLSRFFDRLQREIKRTSCEVEGNDSQSCLHWKVTIIGHSMGSIVLNEVLRRFPDLHFDNIVYMAAACSLHDYEDSAFPYLLNPAHEQTKLYHLTLHNSAEIREQYWLEIPPRGSLLVWIDHLLENPLVFRDRSAGMFDNLLLALPDTPGKLLPRIRVKTFEVGKNSSAPQSHGDFGDAALKFWRESFWKPEGLDGNVDQNLCAEVEQEMTRGVSAHSGGQPQ